MGYLFWDMLSNHIQSYPNSQKISLHILTYPNISYHIPTYPKISLGANSQMFPSCLDLFGPACPALSGSAPALLSRADPTVVLLQ